MGDGKDSFNWLENLSLQPKRNPRDLLQRFSSIDTCELPAVTRTSKDEEEEDDGIELSLGLSLGGRFGVDKSKLIRSSSIASIFPVVRDDADVPAPPERPPPPPGLVRTASLPVVGMEEEWRKRKELQTMRRMAAKRRRSEKQRAALREAGGGGGSGGPAAVPPLYGIPNWVPPVVPLGGGKVAGEQLKGDESLGGSSSGGFELAQGEASPGSVHSIQDRSNQELAGSSMAKGKEKVKENPSKRPENVEKRSKDTGTSSLEDMPCVFTQGDGPNGRRIEGILYRYGKGEEVRIMCVCHGKFHSPAEFVEHAGGMDLAHPLKHIVVNPSSNSYV